MSNIYKIKCRILDNEDVIGVLPLSDDEKEVILQHIEEKTLNEIINGFHALVENVEEITDIDYEKGTIKEEDIECIDVDIACAYDEYSVCHNSKKGNHYDIAHEFSNLEMANHYILVEVVTEEVAKSNDLDFIDDEDERKEYELYNQDYSNYVPLELGAYAQRPM